MYYKYYICFEDLTVVVMSSVFWDVTSCSLSKPNQRFGGIYHLHLQVQRISQGRRNQHEADTADDFEGMTQRYILEDRTLHVYHTQNSL
jgi:hypothetical protein